PKYVTLSEGTPQKPAFVIEVSALGKNFKGFGESKQQAEQQAAKSALERLFKN
ncbi:MAG: ribonuclease III, partial [Clostridia bacterium]|nr:ribonuclease III [Clostridia bacterium]